MGTEVLRIGAGAIVGVQLTRLVESKVPSGLAGSAPLVVLAIAAIYVMWGGRPRGAMGDLIDGVMVGLAAGAATSLFKVPGA